jgi:hypothetical protein
VGGGLQHARDGGGDAGGIAADGVDEGRAHPGSFEGDGPHGQALLDQRAALGAGEGAKLDGDLETPQQAPDAVVAVVGVEGRGQRDLLGEPLNLERAIHHEVHEGTRRKTMRN